MKKYLLFSLLMVVCSMLTHAQEHDANYLHEIADIVKGLRKGNNTVRNTAIETLSADNKPKITLMDEIKISDKDKANEVRGTAANLFKLNQLITYVYNNQNHVLESKNMMLNGNEKDVHYSAIEKSLKRGSEVTYMLKGRLGKQVFMFVPYTAGSKYKVTIWVVGKEFASKVATDVCEVLLPTIFRRQTISISIDYFEDKANKRLVESFAILNYNPQGL